MEVESIFAALVKIFWIAFLFYLICKVYEFVYLPWRIRFLYRNNQNVSMNKKFYPMIGDLGKVVKNEKENKQRLRQYIDLALERKNYDINVTQLGSLTLTDILSPQALSEFKELIPLKIDRDYNENGFPIGNIIPGCFAMSKSTKETINRRKEVVKVLWKNFISQYIPMMLEIVDNWAITVVKNQRIDLSLEISKIVFRIIARILFGNDNENMPLIPYSSPETGLAENLDFETFYLKYTKDEIDGFLNPKGKFFPFLVKYGLVEPYKSNIRNNKSLFEAIKAFIAITNDNDSVYKKLESLGKFSQDNLLNDTAMLLYGGFDTVSHLLTSCLYQLKKYPNELKKLNDSIWKLSNIKKI